MLPREQSQGNTKFIANFVVVNFIGISKKAIDMSILSGSDCSIEMRRPERDTTTWLGTGVHLVPVRTPPVITTRSGVNCG